MLRLVRRIPVGSLVPWLLLAWLLTGPGAASAGEAPARRDGLEVSGFTLSRAGNAQVAERVQASFAVRNVSGAPLRLGSKFGAFVAARWSTRSHPKLNRDFGHQAREARLAPGATLQIQASLILDMPGDWSLWPAVQAGEQIVSFEEMARELKVLFGDEPEPRSAAEQVETAAKGGASLVIWQDQELPIQVFPPDNPWNEEISSLRRHPMSDQWIAAIGPEVGLQAAFGSGSLAKKFTTSMSAGRPFGIPFSVVRQGQALAQVKFEMAGQSDPGPYPIPANPPTEGAGYDHIIVLHYDEKKLYEARKAEHIGPLWYALSGAVFDLTSNRMRHPGHVSAADSGLPIFPGLVRWEEVAVRKSIDHALRFTAGKTQKAYMLPATHSASDSQNPKLPPLGMRVRLRQDFDVTEFPPSAQVILKALKTYGMFLSDQGKDWHISGAPDERWQDDELDTLKRVKGHDLEVVDSGVLIQ